MWGTKGKRLGYQDLGALTLRRGVTQLCRCCPAGVGGLLLGHWAQNPGAGLHLGALHERTSQSQRQALGAGGTPLPCPSSLPCKFPPAALRPYPEASVSLDSWQGGVHRDLATPWPGGRGRIHCGNRHLPNLCKGHSQAWLLQHKD